MDNIPITPIVRACIALLLIVVLLWLLLARPGLPARSDIADYRSAVNTDALKKHVELLSQNFVPRSYNYPQNLDKIAAFLATEFRSSGAKVSEQVFEAAGNQYRNVPREQ